MCPQEKQGLIHPDGRSFSFTSKSASYRYSFGTYEQIGSGDEILKSASTEDRIILSMQGITECALDRKIYSDSEITLYGASYDIPPFTPKVVDIGNIGRLAIGGDRLVAEVEVPQSNLRTIVTMFTSRHPPFFTLECDNNPEGIDGADWLVTSIRAFRNVSYE